MNTEVERKEVEDAAREKEEEEGGEEAEEEEEEKEEEEKEDGEGQGKGREEDDSDAGSDALDAVASRGATSAAARAQRALKRARGLSLAPASTRPKAERIRPSL
eukprot:5594499-Pleurochrysis_carterae.AAC.1